MRQLLIVGVDPGATSAYAVLDIDGNILKIESSKKLDLNTIIRKVTRLGCVLAVGCDKAKVPSFVDKFATKTGGFVISPEFDMQQKEKRRFVGKNRTSNDHEFDALASAVSAYKRIRRKIDRIMFILKKQGRLDIKSEVIKLVFSNAGLNIKEAIKEVDKN